MREVERYLILQVVDLRWREHLEAMEYLRDGIHLRAMAQKDPLAEYRAEGHTMFEELRDIIREEVVRYLLRIQIERPQQEDFQPRGRADGGGDGGALVRARVAGGRRCDRGGGRRARRPERGGGGAAVSTAGAGAGAATSVATTGQRVASEWDRVGRNDPCPCGSGKKYKKCHGA